jgi:hypothetical protein
MSEQPVELEPVLRDVRATTDLELMIEGLDTRPGEQHGLVVEGTGVFWWEHETGQDLVVTLADQVQDVVVEELWGHGSNWPACPHLSTTHPLDARVVDGAAWWCCPADGRAVVRVGELRL